MTLKDVRAGGAFNVGKMCGQAAIVYLQCRADPADHSHGAATVLGNPTAWRHAVRQHDVSR
jgi:hypothetical protein